MNEINKDKFWSFVSEVWFRKKNIYCLPREQYKRIFWSIKIFLDLILHINFCRLSKCTRRTTTICRGWIVKTWEGSLEHALPRWETREKWRSDLESRVAQGSFGEARVSKVLCQVEQVVASHSLGKLLRDS